MVIRRTFLIVAFVAVLLFGFSSFYFLGNDEMDNEKLDFENEKLGTGEIKKAVFAGGCFWCMEHDFEKLSGVLEVVSGYSGGTSEEPTYEDYGGGGHIEVIEVSYDPFVISYNDLLEKFWVNVDPTDGGGQFCDRGHSYVSGIFYSDEEEKMLADVSKEKIGEILGETVKTEVLALDKFWKAEDYHQGYADRNSFRYKFYRASCGRDSRLKELWGNVSFNLSGGFVKPSEDELKEMLTPLQFKVTQKNGTERAFDNLYWDNKADGIYVDVVSGEVLFSSKDKFESGTGWPSFTKALVEGNVLEREDKSLFGTRTEVRSKAGDSHLGHVFDDGPGPTGLRYCMNSAALRFVGVEDLESEGYGEWVGEFE